MKFSIITVNFNNPEGLERTIKSVVNQTFKDFEYIIVDGASSKGDVDVIHKYESYISKWVSEKDTGIYNAMNKGVRMASGDYCLFMNSGDELYSPTMLADVAALKITADFIQGIICRPGKKEIFIKPPKEEEITLSWYYSRHNNYHQASLIKRQMLLDHPYNESLRIAADMMFNVECLIKYNCSYQDIDVVIAKYEYGGVSASKHKIESTPAIEAMFQPRIVRDYKRLEYIDRFPANRLMPVVRWISNLNFLKKLRKVK